MFLSHAAQVGWSLWHPERSLRHMLQSQCPDQGALHIKLALAYQQDGRERRDCNLNLTLGSRYLIHWAHMQYSI